MNTCPTRPCFSSGHREWICDAFQMMPAEAGFQLRRVQQGLAPNDWKPMPAVGSGVREIRIHTALEHRVLYVATFGEAVYVLHAFEKRSRTTSQRDLQLARDRFRSLVTRRRRSYEE